MGIFSSVFGSLFDSKPAVNIDGAPMVGDVDIHGNPYGVTETDHGTSDAFASDTTPLGDDSSLFDTSSSFATEDSSSSSMSISTDDSFSPSFCADDTFGSDFSISDDVFSSSWDD